MPSQGGFGERRDRPTVVLGMMDERFLSGKDINYSLFNEFEKRGFIVKVVGNRQALESTGLPEKYRGIAGFLFGDTFKGGGQSGPDESPGAPPKTLRDAVQYVFSRIRVDRLFAYDLFLKVFSKIRPDLFITEWYLPEMLRAAKKFGATTVLWCVDDPMIIEEKWFYGKWFEYASEFDYVFTFSKGAVPFYRENGVVRVDWLPLFFDPAVIGPPSSLGGKRYPVSFVGNRFRDRDPACKRILAPLVRRFGEAVHVFGSGWTGDPNAAGAALHGPVERGKLGEVFRSSKISLNLHRESSYRFAGSLNYRTFEVLGAGGFELMEYLKGVEELFRLGSELVVAHSGSEAVELAQYYLDHDEERERIALQGYRRVMGEHTIAHRVDKILDTVGLH